ncbi:MAG: zinc metallopeptidase [Verrucomicrobiota bacterium]
MTFWILFIGTMALSGLAAMAVRSRYAKWSQVGARSGITGAQAAQRILTAAGISDVDVVPQRGKLTDHYDPLKRRLVLSEANYHGSSVAALGIAAHEAGHAIQHKVNYWPLNARMAAVGVTTFASTLTMILPFVLVLGYGFLGPQIGFAGFMVFVAALAVCMLFNLITLPVEFDATRRAKLILTKTGMISTAEEERGMHQMLDSAAWTYVAAFVTSLAYLLYYLLPLLGGRE